MQLATSKGARVVWVGLPIVSDTGRWGIIERQNERLLGCRGRCRRRGLPGYLGPLLVTGRGLHRLLPDRQQRRAGARVRWTALQLGGIRAAGARRRRDGSRDVQAHASRDHRLGGALRPEVERSGSQLHLDRHVRQVGESRFLIGRVELHLGQPAVQVVVVGLHVEVPVAAEVEQDDPLLAGLASGDGLVDRRRGWRAPARAPGRSPASARTAPRPRRLRSACTPSPPCDPRAPAATATARRRGSGGRPRAPAPARSVPQRVHRHDAASSRRCRRSRRRTALA